MSRLKRSDLYPNNLVQHDDGSWWWVRPKPKEPLERSEGARRAKDLPPSIDQLLARAASSNLYLNNLFQQADGSWWAEFRLAAAGAEYGSNHATADTAFAALAKALAALEHEAKEPKRSFQSLSPGEQSSFLSTLLDEGEIE